MDPNNDFIMGFENLLKKVIGLLEAKINLASIVEVEKESHEVEDLVEKFNYKTRISSTPNRLITSLSI